MGFHKRRILTALARVVLFAFTTNIAFAYKPEENIWKDRTVQVASLPFTPLATSPLTSFHLPSSPKFVIDRLRRSASLKTLDPRLQHSRMTALPGVSLPDTFFTHVNIRDAYQGKNPLS